MSRRDPRPVRNLAAWGYESSTSGTRVEIDVWTVNRVESTSPLPDPADFGVGIEQVVEQAGDIVKVEYAGAAGTGYRRVSTDEPVSQQAFAGAARSAGGDRTDAGTFGPGAEPAVEGPDLNAVIRHGEREVLPPVRRELREIGQKVGREPSRDEDEEEVETAPFSGFENVIRVFPRGGDPYRYQVRNGQVVRI